jgi:hypothetical protein
MNDLIEEAKAVWDGMSREERNNVIALTILPVAHYFGKRRLRKLGAPKWAVEGISSISFSIALNNITKSFEQALDRREMN